jgi:two-component system sensor kinase FixL
MTDLQKLTKAQLIKELNKLRSQQDSREDSRNAANLRHDLEVHQIELEMQNRELRDKQQELELTRDRYADLYEFAPVGYLTLDNKGIIRDINLTATAMLHTSRRQLLNKPFVAYLTNGYSGDLFQALTAALKGDTEQNLELHVKRKDNTLFYARLNMAQAKANEREVRVALMDISDQKRAQSEARENRDALLHAGRLSMLGELSSGIAHEVSQPIAAIAIYAESLQKMAASGRVTITDLMDIAKHLATQAQRAKQVLHRIRSFSRREAPHQTQQNILPVINEAMELVQPALKEHNVALVIHKPKILRDVKIDPVQIIQVLVNLLQNAIEAMRDIPLSERELTIEITMADHKQVEVAILDQGAGIPADLKDQLFMPFFTTRSEGLGLGLSLSHSIIQAHGGRLWAEANHPHGAVFRFTIPIAEDSPYTQ